MKILRKEKKNPSWTFSLIPKGLCCQVRGEYSRAISLLEEKLAAASSRLANEKAAREMADDKIKRLENDNKLLTERYEKRCADVNEALIGVYLL